METLEAILTRRSIREYIPQAVPDELIQELLAAAMQAPSAGNQQPWHFILVTERKQLNALAGVLPRAPNLKAAPLGVTVCVDLELLQPPGFWVQDCSAATQNLLLAAHARGLGAVWLGVYPVEERVAGVKQLLCYPDRSCRCASSRSATPWPSLSRRLGATTRPGCTTTTGRARREELITPIA